MDCRISRSEFLGSETFVGPDGLTYPKVKITSDWNEVSIVMFKFTYNPDSDDYSQMLDGENSILSFIPEGEYSYDELYNELSSIFERVGLYSSEYYIDSEWFERIFSKLDNPYSWKRANLDIDKEYILNNISKPGKAFEWYFEQEDGSVYFPILINFGDSIGKILPFTLPMLTHPNTINAEEFVYEYIYNDFYVQSYYRGKLPVFNHPAFFRMIWLNENFFSNDSSNIFDLSATKYYTNVNTILSCGIFTGYGVLMDMLMQNSISISYWDELRIIPANYINDYKRIFEFTNDSRYLYFDYDGKRIFGGDVSFGEFLPDGTWFGEEDLFGHQYNFFNFNYITNYDNIGIIPEGATVMFKPYIDTDNPSTIKYEHFYKWIDDDPNPQAIFDSNTGIITIENAKDTSVDSSGTSIDIFSYADGKRATTEKFIIIKSDNPCEYTILRYAPSSEILYTPAIYVSSITFEGEDLETVTLDHVTGTLSGVAPETPGVYTMNIRCYNKYIRDGFDYGNYYVDKEVKIFVNNPLTDNVYSKEIYGYEINETVLISPTYDDESIDYRITSGTLPAGLLFDKNTGEISGSTTEPGNYSVTIEANNGVSTKSETKLLSISPPLTFNYSSDTITIPSSCFNSITISPYIIAEEYTCTITSGTLPAGLQMSEDGVITNTGLSIAEGNVEIGITCVTSDVTKLLTLTLNVVSVDTLIKYSELNSVLVDENIIINPDIIPSGVNEFNILDVPSTITINNEGVINGSVSKGQRIKAKLICMNTQGDDAKTEIEYNLSTTILINGILYAINSLCNHFAYIQSEE